MLRWAEALLAISPVLAAALLYGVIHRRLPGKRTIVALAVLEAGLAALLVWQGEFQSLRPGETYTPAHMQGGVLVEGHGR